jgi:hypothetical protein
MNKTTLLAVAIFVALAAVAVTTMREKPERGITRISFTALEPARVDRVDIAGPNPIELRRIGDVWKVGDKVADADAASGLLESVTRMQSTELTSRKRERYADLQVDNGKGAHVQLFGKGQTLADFVVGGSAPGGVYVRVGDAVYVVRGVYPGTFSRARSTWLDRHIFSDKADDVTRVEIAMSGKPAWTLVKQDGQWKPEDATVLPAAQRFDPNAARSLAQALVAARALDVLDEDPGADKTGLGEAPDTLRYTVADGVRELRLGGEAEGGTVYAKASTRGDLLTVGQSLARALRKQPPDLRDWTIMAFEPAGATRLSIASDGKKLAFEKVDAGWRIADASEAQPERFELDPAGVIRRLAGLAAVRAVAEAEPDAAISAGLKKPAAVATIAMADGKTVELAFGAETKHGDDTVVFARGNVDTHVYLVPTAVRDSVLGGLDTFAKRDDGASFANFDPKKLEGLPPEVREAVRKKIEEQKQLGAVRGQ